MFFPMDPRYLLRKYHWYADQSHLASKVTGRPTPDKVHDETNGTKTHGER